MIRSLHRASLRPLPSLTSSTCHDRQHLARPLDILKNLSRPSSSRRGTRQLDDYHQLFRAYRGKNAFLWSCIGLNVAIFGAWSFANYFSGPGNTNERRQQAFSLGTTLRKNFLLSNENLREGRWWTTITAAFSHKDLGHIFVNMFMFQQMGQLLVYTNGLRPIRHFGVLILGSAIAGSAAFLYDDANSHSPAHMQRVGLGFSGVVSGVITAAACLYPWQKLYLFGVLPMPLWLAGVGFVAYDSYANNLPGRTVAHDAHIGGAVFGGIMYLVALRRFGGVLGPRRF